MDHPTDKQQLRSEIRKQRVSLTDREGRSEQIQRSAAALSEIVNAEQVMVYVGYRSEVATGQLIDKFLSAGKSVVVPWCQGEELQLFRLKSVSELQPGAFGIPEPMEELRTLPERQIEVRTLDAVFLPGIAFDRQGNRLGQGKGFYDRLLSEVSEKCILIGLSFEVQLVDDVPTEPHDISLDLIVTESEIIRLSSP